MPSVFFRVLCGKSLKPAASKSTTAYPKHRLSFGTSLPISRQPLSTPEYRSPRCILRTYRAPADTHDTGRPGLCLEPPFAGKIQVPAKV